MQNTDRSKALLEIFRQSLSHYGLVETVKNLGDRQGYIGVSDITSYSQCPRSAVAAKLYPLKDDLSSHLTLQRGHWFEKGVGESLESIGLKQLHQLEIFIQFENTPIKAHLDFTLVWNKPEFAVRVLEVKSMSQLPESPYPQHELQVSTQTALLKYFWNKPAFSIQAANNPGTNQMQTFPYICNKCLGIALPDNPDKVSIEGWLLCLSMKDAAAFGPYEPNTADLNHNLSIGSKFWQETQAIQSGDTSLNELEYVKGFYPLCQYCSFNSDCPKFSQGSFQPEWEDSILELEKLKNQRAKLDEEIKSLENDLKYTGSISSDWIETGGHRFRMSPVKGRRTLDRDLLHNQLADLFDGMGMESMNIDDFISSCEKESAPSSRLVINTIN